MERPKPVTMTNENHRLAVTRLFTMLHHSLLSDLDSRLIELGELTARMHELTHSEGDEEILRITFKDGQGQ